MTDVMMGTREMVRIGARYPYVLDVDRGTEGRLQAVVHTYQIEGTPETGYVEIRKKDTDIGIFIYEYGDVDIPEWWADAGVLWTNRAGVE